MEKAAGCLLLDVWEDLTMLDQGKFAKTLQESCGCKLLDLSFTHYSSLYYKNNVPASLHALTLLKGLSHDDELNSIFCIGPIVHCDFWKAEWEDMDIDQGSCKLL